MRVADMRDAASDRYWARCPDCSGTGRDPHDIPPHGRPCEYCEGDGHRDCGPDKIVTVDCSPCGGSGEEWPVGSHYSAGPIVCGVCKGDGELTGPADEVCA